MKRMDCQTGIMTGKNNIGIVDFGERMKSGGIIGGLLRSVAGGSGYMYIQELAFLDD